MKSKITFFLKKSTCFLRKFFIRVFSKTGATVFLVSFCICTLLTFSVFAFTESEGEREIFSNTLRFHVVANSDSRFDQNLKLCVKDEVFSFASDILSDCESVLDAEKILYLNKEKIRAIAKDTLALFGCDYDVKVDIGKENYPVKHYGAFSFPAGEYLSLRVLIGQAQGENWWCVLFPPLCTKLAVQSVQDIEATLAMTGFSSSAAEFITSDNVKTKVRFKALDIVEKLFKE